MSEDESATDRNAAAQVLREIADEVQAGACKGFGIVCAGGSVGYAAAGLHDVDTLMAIGRQHDKFGDRLRGINPYIPEPVTAITDYSQVADVERASQR